MQNYIVNLFYMQLVHLVQKIILIVNTCNLQFSTDNWIGIKSEPILGILVKYLPFAILINNCSRQSSSSKS